jgi:AraC family transcriptional regulator of adaptative response / DNA-3-methyladenine glycosylase II
MELDATRCYRAILARDARFDGRFFVAVRTTGIYCRPICPAPTPKAVNVRFYACAAAAAAAGYRACLRCRPEAAPGTPAWMGSSAVVSRALRLIAADALDDGDVEGLAARVGLGARQLRRLFAEHLGASPAEIARVRRVHFARALLDDSNLPMSDVAYAAGFRSIRQFNHAVRAHFGDAPRRLRARRRRGNGTTGAAVSARRSAGAAERPRRVVAGATPPGLVVRLAYRPPFDWGGLLRFLARRATPGVEVVDGDVYRRTIGTTASAGEIEVRHVHGERHLLMEIRLPTHDDLLQVVERARRLFDLAADPLPITRQLRRQPELRAAVDARPGLRVPGAWDGFELAVRAVLGQQVTVAGATTLAGRLAAAFGTPVQTHGAGLAMLFPTAPVLADADLTRIGMPRTRAATIRALAAAVASGTLRLDAALGLEDAVARLAAIPGIGEWTAQYIAMRALGEADAFPASDLGLRQALGNGAGPLAAREVQGCAEAWRPWRAYAAIHLWASLEGTR